MNNLKNKFKIGDAFKSEEIQITFEDIKGYNPKGPLAKNTIFTILEATKYSEMSLRLKIFYDNTVRYLILYEDQIYDFVKII